jgi:hypothetical protein
VAEKASAVVGLCVLRRLIANFEPKKTVTVHLRDHLISRRW